MSRSIISIIIVVFVVSMVSIAYANGPIPMIGAEEIKMGKEAAVETDKNCKFVTDPEMVARVQRVGGAIASIAVKDEVPARYGSSTLSQFEYSFKIIDSDEINAFSIPGGHIYINKGLIESCQTDHELAGVLAHEVAHAAHHHMIYLLREQSRIEGKTAFIMVAGLLGKLHSTDMSNVMMGTQYYKTAKISDFGQKAECDADLTAIDYMIQSGYNPVGMLTFLERLAERPDLIDWGILQNHPCPMDRVAAVKDDLTKRGIEINRRAVTTSGTARVCTIDDSTTTVYDVVVGERFICKLKHEESAKAAAAQINDLLDRGLQIREVRVSDNAITARNNIVVEITDEDAALSGKPRAQLASEANDALKRVLVKQLITEVR